MAINFESINKNELATIIWNQLGVRVSDDLDIEYVKNLLTYSASTDEIPKNKFNVMRNKIIKFIQKNREALALPCNGNCYEHSDIVVTSCFIDLEEEIQNGG